ncbi:BTB/POZ domain-containing protein KCTD7 [Striga asiatica]|uniref:BTB/POZ domain-containing protein KCTD7 n=1 Tax=Striga asiatica TaxID=4170 RepID=A0A5A7QRE3_STRAF|nr:BTB/POZ domain-containing protein KCTD7 [Striga asiatica]
MSNANSPPTNASPESAAAGALSKRYEGLVALRTKAVKGKGAWYWAHFEPILVRNPETDFPTAVKLRCTLCDASFSASNPSRTASEHLKRGTCPNFSFTMKPIPHLPPLASPSSHRKRSLESQQAAGTSLDVNPINVIYSSRTSHEMAFLPAQSAQTQKSNPKPPILSGGQEDLRPLAQLEDSVKKLKIPKALSIPTLSKVQIDTAFELLADWFHESCGSVTFSSVEHPKFNAFFNQVGLPEFSKREFLCTRLDSKYAEVRRESEARINDAPFFQIASDGWKSNSSKNGDKFLVNFSVNLPNGTRVFQKAVYLNKGTLPSQYAKEVMWDAVQSICGNNLQRCVGIVADKHRQTALKNLELENNWMVNVSCQVQGFLSLINDLITELPLFSSVKQNCLKIANLINHHPHVRRCIRSLGFECCASFIRVFSSKCDVSKNFIPFTAMLEDLLTCSQILHLLVSDESYKALCLDHIAAREVADIIHDAGFWKNAEAARFLVMQVMSMVKEMETERPLISQCLPLWNELRAKMKEWCAKHGLTEGPVERIIEARFAKNYHPAWPASFILDPLNLVKDENGKYLPPFNLLTSVQEEDVERLVIRLVPKEEADVALMELVKWRSEGLDPLYAQAVQVRQRDNLTGKLKIANPQSSRLVWESCCLKELKSLSKVAVRLLCLHGTAFGFEWDRASMGWFCGPGSGVGLERARKMAYVAAQARLGKRDVLGGEEMELCEEECGFCA